jgi:hypothetical protein
MIDPVSIAISLVSLSFSATTLWFTLLRRGRLKMTKPTLVFFGYDFVPRMTPKIFLRTLLYSTSVRGKVIEGMFVKVVHESSQRIFSFWGYAENKDITPGSGLHVSQAGVGANHHFVLSVSDQEYQFKSGHYSIEVFARLVTQRSPQKLLTVELDLNEREALALAAQNGVLFHLQPDTDKYLGDIDERPRPK